MIRLKLNGEFYEYFTNFSISLKFNSIASDFNINAYFNPFNEAQKKLFKPLSGVDIKLYDDDALLFVGTILNVKFSRKTTQQLVTISGYSKTGILENCNIPLDLYPLESNNLSLYEIAKKLCKKFGIGVIVSSAVKTEANKIIEKTSAKASETIKEYLSRLCNERNIVLTHTATGSIVLTKANTSQKASWVYDESDDKVLSINGSVQGQQMHSSVSVIRQASIKTDNAGESKSSNIFVSQYKPLIKIQSSGTDNDTVNASVKAVLSELKNIKFTVEYDGFIHRPNTIIEIKEPFVYLYDKTRLFVESVTVKGDNRSMISSVEAVIPETYSGVLPSKNIFS